MQSIHFPSSIQFPHCPLQKLKGSGTAWIVQKSEQIFWLCSQRDAWTSKLFSMLFFFLSAGSPAGPSVTPHLFFGHSAAFRLWLMAQPRLERPVPNWWFNIYIRVACHHLIKSTSDFLQLLIIRTIQFSVSILIPFNFFLSCYTSQVLGSCQKPRFRFAVTTLLFFVFPAMAAGYIAPYYPSTTEEEVAGRWTPIFGEEGYVDPWPLTLQKDGFWLNSIKEGITCLKSWSICNA